MEGFRQKQLAERKKRKKAQIVKYSGGLLVVLTLLSLLLSLGKTSKANNKNNSVSNTGKGSERAEKKNPVKRSQIRKTSSDGQKPIVKTSKVSEVTAEDQTQYKYFAKTTLIGLIAINDSDNENNEGFYGVLILSPEIGNASMIKVNINTVADIPGVGFDRIDKAYNAGGVETTLNVLGNIFSQKISNYLIFHSKQQKSSDIPTLFLSGKESNLTSEQRVFLNKKLKRKKISIKDLPARKISINNDSFYQPDNDKISQVVKGFYDEEITTNNKINIEIYNANGSAGIASLAAVQLIKKGFLVGAVSNYKNKKNQDYFGSTETKIIYGNTGVSKAEEIRNLLKVGIVEKNSGENNKVIIILGSDYKQK